MGFIRLRLLLSYAMEFWLAFEAWLVDGHLIDMISVDVGCKMTVILGPTMDREGMKNSHRFCPNLSFPVSVASALR